MNIRELGHVVLYVTNLEQSANFYGTILGFREIARERGVVVFSTERTHHELLLIEIGGVAEESPFPKAGLYHIGFKIGDGPEALQEVYRELKGKVQIIGATDHGVTHSLYIKDPDGNELELYADVSDEWKTNPQAILAPARTLKLE
jgi:catechol-2,3-dioxygenase